MLGQKLTKVNVSRPLEWACRELSANELVAVSGGLDIGPSIAVFNGPHSPIDLHLSSIGGSGANSQYPV